MIPAAAPVAPTTTETTPTHKGDAVPILAGLTACLLPFLAPAGPGNTAAADLMIAASIAAAFVWVTREHVPVRLPYLWGVALMVLGGALAALLAHAPISSALVLGQDLLLVLWCATIALGRQNPAIIASVTRAWCRTAAVFATVGVAAYLTGLNALSGVTAKDGVRASYTLGDPNLAGNYLVVSLFLMMACKCPRSPSLRRLAYLMVLLAMGFTGSNGAMLTLLVGAGLAVTLWRYQSGALWGTLTLAISLLLASLMVFFVMPRVDLGSLREHAAGSVPLLRDSFGRSGSSTSERATIVEEGITLFMRGDVTGYGPARTKATFQATQAPYVKEAHNDYLATLLERGVLGALGLLVVAAAVVSQCTRLLMRGLPPPYDAIVPRPWLLVVIAPVMATAAGFYETLHFRHLWTWLGLIAALTLAVQEHESRRHREDTE